MSGLTLTYPYADAPYDADNPWPAHLYGSRLTPCPRCSNTAYHLECPCGGQMCREIVGPSLRGWQCKSCGSAFAPDVGGHDEWWPGSKTWMAGHRSFHRPAGQYRALRDGWRM